jgi:hypothetical protein
MKRNWRTRRQTKECLDGQQRWDRAYLYLLEWTLPSQAPNSANAPSASPAPTSQATQDSEEESNANSSLCPRLDDQPSPSTND